MTVHHEQELIERLPETYAVIRDGMNKQLHSGCQLYISSAGMPIVDCGVGESFPGQPMTSETINLWLSAGKPLTAVAVLKLWDQNRLDLDDFVSQYLPDFGVAGKERITFRHLLTHTGGFRMTETGWPEFEWNQIIRHICEASVEPNWVIGQTAGYHTSSSWFILGEILARLTGRSYVDAMRIQLFEPLGLNGTWSALSTEQLAVYGDKIGRIFARERGELQLLDWHLPLRCGNPSPGANTRGPIRDLGRFYEMLLHRGVGDNGRILSTPAVEALTARHRVGRFDQTLAHIVDFGLGVIIDSNQYGPETVPYGYGRYCSPRTFGHGGAQSSQGWCDPERGLVVAYFFNGRPGEGQHNRRARQLNEAIYTDLGLI
jgi:CubicO group peptidase (beta-lactamase class C family)